MSNTPVRRQCGRCHQNAIVQGQFMVVGAQMIEAEIKRWTPAEITTKPVAELAEHLYNCVLAIQEIKNDPTVNSVKQISDTDKPYLMYVLLTWCARVLNGETDSLGGKEWLDRHLFGLVDAAIAKSQITDPQITAIKFITGRMNITMQ